jgi:hypothetical protein
MVVVMLQDAELRYALIQHGCHVQLHGRDSLAVPCVQVVDVPGNYPLQQWQGWPARVVRLHQRGGLADSRG